MTFLNRYPPLQPQPPAQRPGEREFVHEFEVAAEGHAAGQTGDYEVGEVAKHARKVGGGGFAFGIGVGGQDDFTHLGDVPTFHVVQDTADALKQGSNAQVFGSNISQGIERPTKHVIPPAVFTGAFDDLDVFGFFNHANNARVAPRIGAEAADFFAGDVAADAAEGDAVLHGPEGVDKPVDVGGFGGEEVEGDPLGAFWTYAW